MKYNCKNVGIVLLVYNRPSHTQKVLDAIKKSNIRNFAIYMDAPSTEEDRFKQNELTEIIQGINWANCRFIKRTKALGLAKSVVSSITDQLREYEQIILLEDDCVPLEGFFEFMFSALEKYKNNKHIRSICGYQFPFVNFPSKSIEGVLIRRFIPWGWATWRNRWKDYDEDLKHIIHFVEKRKIFNSLPQDIKTYSLHENITNGRCDIWSINWVLVHYLTDTYALLPSVPLIENIGFDGTGIHCIKVRIFKIKNAAKIKRNIRLNTNIALDVEYDKKVQKFLETHSHKTMKIW